MGNLFTRPLPNPTPAETKNILSTILREMFKRADLIDLQSLADPERCKRYVVVAESALQKLFASYMIEPTMGKDGILFFQKIEGIQKANPLGDKQDTYCKMLAFFFIRIFQTYAALTLSVVDGDLPTMDPTDIIPGAPGTPRGLLVIQPTQLPGIQQAKKKRWFGFGGALSSSGDYRSFYLNPEQAGPYRILNQFLIRPSGGVGDRGDMHFQDYSNMTMDQGSLYTFPGDVTASRTLRTDLAAAPPAISYSYKPSELSEEYVNLIGNIALTREGDKLVVKLQGVKLLAEPTATGVNVGGELFYRPPTTENPLTTKGKNLTGLLVQLFQEAYDGLKPSDFSPIEFLFKHKIIKGLDRTVPIEGTKATIQDPRGLAARRATNVPITYRDRLKLDNETKDVTLETTLKITKKRVIEGHAQEYDIQIDTKGLTTIPVDLRARLNLPEEFKHSVFSTGVGDTNAPSNSRGESINLYLQKLFEGIMKSVDTASSTGGIEYKKGIPQPYNSERIPREFKIKAMWQALAKDPPVKAHCVARAVQLLNVAAIRGDMTSEGYSQVCRLKFPYVKDGSLPEAGKSILTESGIAAMAMLFVDTLAGQMPKVSDSPKFAEFRQRMKTFFERYEKVEGTEVPKALDDITEKMMPFCEGRLQQKIRVEGALLRELHVKAKELMDRQARHLRAVMAILFKMFNATKLKAGVLEFNSEFISRGMESVNAVAREARDLLIEYYGDCERTYKDGLYALHRKSLKDTDFVPAEGGTPAPAAAAPATATPSGPPSVLAAVAAARTATPP